MSTDETLPTAPWAKSRPRRARQKAPLTREAIVDAAIELLDAEGLDGVSMRRVAERLDTGAASFYQHVDSKEGLLELMLDRVIGELEIPPPDPDDWQTPLKAALRSMRDVLARHRDIAYVTFGRIPTGPNALRVSEGVLAIMRAGGVPPRVAAFALDSLTLFIGAVAYEEAIQAVDWADEMSVDHYIAEARGYFASLPPDRFPTIVSMAETLTSGHGDDRFEFALDVQIRGIAALSDDG